ncbi:MAG TPA: HAD family hydrolase, partial [Armatimonadota bacterium]|nr:HAD family hydrolase [Armatimonadota bacterium]
AKLSNDDIQTIATAVYTGMTVEDFQKTVRDWLATARHPRWNKPYTALIYEPMLELMRYLRANGYKTYMVTGGGQEFVRAYAYPVYGIPPEQIIGSALATQYAYNSAGQGVLIRSPKLLLMNNLSGKPEDIYLFIGRRPQMAAGNTDGDQQMLEYTQAGNGPHLLMLILHDDPVREYAYGPARGLPATSGIGSFSTALLNEATQRGWQVISMKNDWKRIFAFQQ